MKVSSANVGAFSCIILILSSPTLSLHQQATSDTPEALLEKIQTHEHSLAFMHCERGYSSLLGKACDSKKLPQPVAHGLLHVHDFQTTASLWCQRLGQQCCIKKSPNTIVSCLRCVLQEISRIYSANNITPTSDCIKSVKQIRATQCNKPNHNFSIYNLSWLAT